MKVMYVLICILISMKLGKILFIEKLDVIIKKIMNIFLRFFVIIINLILIIIMFVTSQAQWLNLALLFD